MSSPILVHIGNPLLDMQVKSGEELLKKYNLKPDDAILAEGKQLGIYDDIKANYPIDYVAGGASQNAARFAQYALPPNSTAFIGCVGKDDFADQLRAANKKEGMQEFYQVVEDKQTGACAVIITGHHRSLCTYLGAAESFSPSHLETPPVKSLLENAKYYYMEGYFLTHGLESAKIFSSYAKDEQEKFFAVNLSAPFIAQFFTKQLDEIMPYTDILFGNESEALAYATAKGWETKDIPTIAAKIAHLPKYSSTKPRLVLITQGADQTVLATPSLVSDGGLGDNPDAKHRKFDVTKLSEDEIVDTNAAGDAFAGGFLAGIILNKAPEQCIELAHRLAKMCIGQIGPQLRWPKEDVVSDLM